MSTLPMPPTVAACALGDPQLRSALVRCVARRVDAADVEDVVQMTFVEAVASLRVPENSEEVRRFVFFIAGQKVADLHRRRGREQRSMPPAQGTTEAHSAEADLLRWAERTVPANRDARQTLEWMLREGDGETLADIAARDGVAAATVRQRVSRLRRYLRKRWSNELALGTLLGVMAIGLIASLLYATHDDEATRAVPSVPSAPSTSSAPSVSDAPDHRIAPDPSTLPPPAAPAQSNDIVPAPPLSELRPFDLDGATKALAAINAASCAPQPMPPKRHTATITFDPNGSVSSVTIEGSLAGATCIRERFGSARVPAFDGAPVTLRKAFVYGVAPRSVPSFEPGAARLGWGASYSGAPSFDFDSATRMLETINMASCAPPSTAETRRVATITFEPQGFVSAVTVDSTLAGTPAETCIRRRFLDARVPVFDGAPVTLRKSFAYGVTTKPSRIQLDTDIWEKK
jgi:DNA-directed RNA polymerase specialized sigma24 family protein